MTYDEVNDDLGLAIPPFRVVAAMAVNGRLPLLEHTITRLYKKNGCYKVICSGDNPQDKELCTSLGAVWTPRRNKPLGTKWNSAFEVARDYDPDAVVFVGSSDWLSDNWFSIMRPYVEQFGFTGVPGCHMADLGNTLRVVSWPGYATTRRSRDRDGECIGIGRMLSKQLLNAVDWKPLNPLLDNSLDNSMNKSALKVGFTNHMVVDSRLIALSISTNKWLNKHKFYMHWDGAMPSKKIEDPEEFLKNNFPEALQLFESFNPKPNENESSRGLNTEDPTPSLPHRM